MVAGDIRDLPNQEGGELAEAGPLPGRSAGWPKPVGCGGDDFDVVSDCSTSSADEMAPRASSMADSVRGRVARPFTFRLQGGANTVPW